MGYENYMRQSSNGDIQVLCANLPDKVFVDAVKTKDICKLKFLSAAEKANRNPGDPDVKLIKATGEIILVNRRDVTKEYTHSNGKKITLAFLKNNREYIIYKNCNEQYKVMKMPDNFIGMINNSRVKQGSYIVAPVDSNGNIIRDKIGVVSPNIFKKMFKIPMQAVIRRHIGGNNKSFSLFTNKSSLRNKIQNDRNMQPSTRIESPIQEDRTPINRNNTRVDTRDLGMNPSNIKIPTRNSDKDENINSKYQYTVINKLVNMNNTLVGFSVKEIKSGVIKQVNSAQLSVLCEQKLVDNVMIVKKERTGTKFLKGNGIILNSLPSVLI